MLANSGVIDLSTSGTLSVDVGTLQMAAGGDLTGDGEIRFAGDLEVASGVSFAVTSPSLIFDGGNFGGAGTLQNESDIAFVAAGDISGTFVHAGALTIAGVAVSATGIELSASGSVTLNGSTGDASLAESDGLLLNSGLVTISGGVGSLVGSTVSNATGGSIVVESGAVLRQDGGDAFVNAGEIALLGEFEMTGGSAVNSGTLAFTGGTLTLTDNAVFTQDTNLTLGIGSEIGLDGASLDGSGSLSIEGLMTLVGGAVVSNAAVANSGTISLSGGTLTSSDVTNNGVIDVDGASSLNQGVAGTVDNSGTISVQNDAVLSAASGLLENNGTVELSSSGTLLVSGGTLGLNSGGAISADAGSALVSLNGGDVFLGGNFALDGDLTLAAAGTQSNGLALESFTFTNNGTVDIAAGASLDVTAVAGGAFVNAATLDVGADVTFGGALVNDGLLAIAGATVTSNGLALSAGGTVTLDGSSSSANLVDSGGVLLNSGLIAVTAGVGSLGGSTVSNAGTVSVENGATLQQAGGGTVLNTGELDIAAGATVTVGIATASAAAFDNTGIVSVDGDLLLRNTVFTQSAGTLEIGGSLGLAEGSTLDLGTAVTLSTLGTLGLGDGGIATARIGGSSAFEIHGALVFDNGVLAVDTVNHGSISTNDGRYDVSGTLSFQDNGSIDLGQAKILAGGGTFAFTPGAGFPSGVDLTDDTIATLTTANVASGMTLTVSDTVVDGVLDAANGASVAFDGALTGDGTFTHGAAGSTLMTVVNVASLANSGTIELSGGALSSASLENNGLLDVAASSLLDPSDSGTASNSETIAIQDGAVLTFGDGTDDGVLFNSGTIDVSPTGTLSVAGGTLQLAAGGSLSGDGEIRLAGDLEIASGVSFTLATPSLVFDGGNIGGAGTLDNQGAVTFAAAGNIGGTFLNNGALRVDGVAVIASGIDLSSGGVLTLDGTDGDASLAESGSLLLNSGLVTVTGGVGSLGGTTVSNAGTIIVEDGTVLRQDGGGTLLNAGEVSLSGVLELIGGTATNSGVLTFADGTLSLSGGASFDQNTDLTVGTDSSIVLDNATLGGSGTLTNAGTLSLSVGTLSSVDVSNSGIIDVIAQSVLDAGGTGTIDNSGTLSIQDSAVLSFNNGVFENNDVIDLSSSGTLSVAGGTLGLNIGGTIVAETGSAAVVLDGGNVILRDNFTLEEDLTLAATGTQTNSISLDTLTFTSDGIVSIAANAELSIDGLAGSAFVNQGTLDIGDGGSVSLTSVVLANTGGIIEIGGDFGLATVDGDLSMDLASALQIGIGATGTVTENDRLAVTGDLALGGTLSVSEVDTFSLGVGDSFEVVSAGGTLTRSFDRAVGLESSEAVILNLTQEAGGVTLTGVAVTNLGLDDSVNGDTLVGSSGVEVFLARDGDDRFESGGGLDLMHGGEGNDIFVAVDTGFGRFDGGTGEDTLLFAAGDDQTFNLRPVRGDQISSIERIDIANGTLTVLQLDADTVLSAINGTNSATGTLDTLIIDGGAGNGDTVEAFGDWAPNGTTTIGGTGYSIFLDSSSGAQIFVGDANVTVTPIV